jgi:hypothetical protein
MTTRKYSSRSQQTTLSAPITSTATTMTVGSGSSLVVATVPNGQTFTVVIDPDTALEEIVDVTNWSSGNTLTIERGVDGSSGIAHSAGAVVKHMAIGRDYREANTHIEGSLAGHTATTSAELRGVISDETGTGSLVFGTSPTIASPTITGTGAIAGTFTGNITGNVTGNVSGNAGTVTNGVYTTDTGTVTSTMIANGTIVDADVNSAAAIAKTKISGTAITAADTGTVTSTMIADGTIVNADVNSSAQIAYGKLALTNSVVNADINASAAIDKTKISGTAITAADSGTVTSTMIADGTIVNADINASAAIDWTKIAPSSTVSATELGYLDGVTSAVQTQIDSKLATSTAASTYAPLVSPPLTGTPTAPTATAGTNTTQVATTAFVKTAVDNVIAAAPGALDTLDELAAALGDDANFATTVTNNLATKLPLAGGTMSGAIAMGTNKITGLGTPTSSTDASTKAYADTMLPLAGGTMSGAIAMGTNKITGVGDPTTAQDAATKNYVDTTVIAPTNLTGPITSVANVTSVASQTGTGSKFVMDTSPTLVTPVLGVATATSINGTTIPSSKTLVATDSTVYVVPSQTGNANKFLKTDGTTSSWAPVAGALAQPTEPSSPDDGQIWVDTDGTAPTTVVTRWSKAVAAGTTSLTGNDDNSIPLAYRAGFEQVFLNGALLSRSNDYTATNGNTVTLTTATVAGDIVEIICPLQISTTDTYTQSATNAAFQANTNNFAAGKNKIINGDFGVWQRGTSFSYTSTTDLYTADRWRIQCNLSSGTSTVSQQSFTVGTAPVSGYESQYFLRVTNSAGATNVEFQQRLEDVRLFAGQTVTISFWAKASNTVTMANTIIQNFGTGGSSSVSTTGTSQTLTTSWARYSTTINVPSIAGKTIGAGNNLAVYPMYYSSGTIASNVIDIWGVQIEVGSNATAFQTATGNPASELAACQRYYYRSIPATTYGYLSPLGTAVSTTSCLIRLGVPVTMRATPTSVDFSTVQVSPDDSNIFAVSNIVLGVGINASNVMLGLVSSGLTQFRPYYAAANGTTAAYIGVSAEL